MCNAVLAETEAGDLFESLESEFCDGLYAGVYGDELVCIWVLVVEKVYVVTC